MLWVFILITFFDKILICNHSNSFYEEISKELSDSFYCVPFLLGNRYHYANMSVQYTAIFHGCKNDNFHMIFFLYFSYFCSKYRLWVHVRTASVRRF